MKPKHTPGPWKIRRPLHPKITAEERLDRGITAYVDGKEVIIAETFGQVDSSVFLDSEVNAQLIVAAPEMLKALHWMIDMVNGAYAGRRHGMAEKIAMLVTVEEIIAKAEGKKS